MNNINYTKQFIDNDDKKAVLNVLNSDYLTQGKYISDFEDNLSTFFKQNIVQFYQVVLQACT